MHQLFFNLLLVFLPTQLGLHFWPSWAMVLGRRVDYLSPTIYVTDLLTLLILGSWVIYQRKEFSIFNFQFSMKQRNFQFSIFKILLFVGFIGLNIFFATNKMVVAYGWLKILEFGLLGFYIFKTKPKFSSMIFSLSTGVLYSSLIAIGQFIMQRSIGGPLWFLGERTFSNLSPGIAQFNLCKPLTASCTLLLRAYGTFPHPNVLGGFLAVMLPLISNLQINKSTNLQINERIFKIYKWVAVSLGSVALILTFSRSAWVAAILGIGILNYKLWKKKKIFFPAIAVLAGIIFWVVGTFGFQDESVSVRGALNNSAIQMFWQSPIVGKGLGNFLVELPKNLVSRQIYFLQPVHNIYLLLLTETGVIGFACFLWVIWKTFGIVIRDTKYAIRQKNIPSHLTYHVSLITLLLLGLVDHYPFTLQQGQLLFTIFLSLSLIR